MQFVPMALSIGMAVATDVLQYTGERQLASSQEKQNEQTTANAIQARNNDLATIEERRLQEQDAAAQQAQQSQAEAMQERSADLAASAASGQSGLSVNALLQDHLRQQLNNETTIAQNLSDVNKQLDRARQATAIEAQSRVNQEPVVQYPSFLGTLFKVGTDTYTNYEKYKPPSASDALAK